MFGVAAGAGAGVAAAALAVVSAAWVSGFAQPANMNNAALAAADTTNDLLETRLMENELLI